MQKWLSLIILQEKKSKNKLAADYWPSIQIFIIKGSRFGEANALLNLISPQPGIDNIYLYAKDP